MLTVPRAAATGLLAGALGVAVACAPLPSPSASTTPLPTVPASPAPPTATPAAAPTATVAAALRIEDLPDVQLDPDTLTAICDPEPNQSIPDAGEASMLCVDGLLLGIRATRKATAATARRAHLIRPACQAAPCPPASLQTASVVVWTDAGTYAVRLDSTLDTVSYPEPAQGEPWPAARDFTSPATKRGDVAGAPGAVATRVAYPYCGRASYEKPLAVLACFRDSVLLGRRAEAILRTYGTEGGEVLDVVRFDGAGALINYEHVEGRWILQRGDMVLGPRDGTWSFEPWSAGDVIR